MASRKIEVEVIGDTKSLERAMGRAGKASQSTFSKIQKGAKYAGLALSGGLAVAAKIGFDELSQSLKVGAQTEAVLKSTGGAANVTAGQVDNLAQSLLNKSGVDDEVIKSGENMLLTFRNIRNEAGKGNDIFTQTTKATLDLSVAMGKDMKSSAVLVGKALNDPVKGLSALTRVGVSFTAQQQKQIKALASNGHEMKAQKIILGELNKEFGGSAAAAGKTLPGQLNIAKETFKNLAASIVQTVLPAFQSFAGGLLKVTTYLSKHKTTAKALVGVIAALAAVLLTVSVATKLWAAATGVAAAASKAFAAAQWLVNAALDANPIGLIIVGLVALGVALVVAYKKSATFRAIVQGALHAVQRAASAVAGAVRGPLVTAFRTAQKVVGAVVAFIRAQWATLKPILLALLGPIGIVISHIGTIKSAIQTVIRAAKKVYGAFQAGFGAVKSILGPVVSFIQSIIDKIKWVTDHLPGISSGHVGPSQSPGGHSGSFRGGVTPHALGGMAYGGQVSLVGERGPELRLEGSNARYLTATQTRAALSGGGPVNVNVMLGPDTMREFARVEVEAYGRKTSRSLTAGSSRAT